MEGETADKKTDRCKLVEREKRPKLKNESITWLRIAQDGALMLNLILKTRILQEFYLYNIF